MVLLPHFFQPHFIPLVVHYEIFFYSIIKTNKTAYSSKTDLRAIYFCHKGKWLNENANDYCLFAFI